MRTLSCALAVLALIGFMVAPAAAQSAKDSIEAALVTFEEAYNSGDAAAVAALYTEDAALLPPDMARMDGKEAVQSFWQGAMDSGLENLRLETVEVEESGDIAYEVGNFTLAVPSQDGAPADVNGKYIVVWKKGPDGTWRLHRDIWNTDPTPQQ
jgi:uncharacterized protein (TIGR02246 family)